MVNLEVFCCLNVKKRGPVTLKMNKISEIVEFDFVWINKLAFQITSACVFLASFGMNAPKVLNISS